MPQVIGAIPGERVTIDGTTDVRLVAPASDSLCAVMAPFLVVLDGFGGALSVVDFQPERLASSMTFDADGYLWLADGSNILARRAPEALGRAPAPRAATPLHVGVLLKDQRDRDQPVGRHSAIRRTRTTRRG